jgi:hypothetical protein
MGKKTKTGVALFGFANRAPDAEEVSVVRRWAAECGFGWQAIV